MEITIGLGMLQGFGMALGPAVLRSLIGWAQNSFKDGKIDKFEIRKLGETLLRVGFLTAAVYFSWDGLGDAEALASGFAAVVIDILFRRK